MAPLSCRAVAAREAPPRRPLAPLMVAEERGDQSMPDHAPLLRPVVMVHEDPMKPDLELMHIQLSTHAVSRSRVTGTG